MKKVYLIFLILIWGLCIESSFADNAIYLKIDDSDKTKSFHSYQKGGISVNNRLDYSKATDTRKNVHNTLLYDDVNKIQLQKKSYSQTLEKNINSNASIGTKYTANSSSDKYNDTVSVFSKYKKDKFSFTSSVNQNRNALKQTRESASFSFAPEYKVNDHLSLKRVYTDNFNDKSFKHELVLSVKPLKTDRLNMDFGAGQTLSKTNTQDRSQINFSTNFKF